MGIARLIFLTGRCILFWTMGVGHTKLFSVGRETDSLPQTEEEDEFQKDFGKWNSFWIGAIPATLQAPCPSDKRCNYLQREKNYHLPFAFWKHFDYLLLPWKPSGFQNWVAPQVWDLDGKRRNVYCILSSLWKACRVKVYFLLAMFLSFLFGLVLTLLFLEFIEIQGEIIVSLRN